MAKFVEKQSLKNVHARMQLVRSSSNNKGVEQLFLKFQKLKPNDMLYFTFEKWNFLTFINLYCNDIGNKGCKYLSRANIKNLQYINLGDNKIESIGVSHLSKAQWKKLDILYLNFNTIGLNGVSSLVKTLNDGFSQIYLNDNKLRMEQLLKLEFLPQGKNVYIHLSDNLLSEKQKQTIREIFGRKWSNLQLYV